MVLLETTEINSTHMARIFVRTRSKATAVLSFLQSPWAAGSSWGSHELLSPCDEVQVPVLLSVALSQFFSYAGLLR